MDEEDIFVITRFRIKYREDTRRNAINEAVIMSATGRLMRVTGPYTVERCNSFWDPAYVLDHLAT